MGNCGSNGISKHCDLEGWLNTGENQLLEIVRVGLL